MFITFSKRQFNVHDAQTTNIMFTRTMPDEILDAQLSGDILTITMPKRIHLLKRIGNTFQFTFFREMQR